MRKLIAVTALSVAIAGCASSGQKITQGQIDQVVQGVTTQDDLIAIFGQPLSQQYNSDGTRVLSWAYAYVGFAGVGTETQGLSVVIGPDGKVSGFTRSGSTPQPARFGP